MKWYVIPALITCGLNSMLASIVLCLAVFHLLTDKSTNAPIEPNEEWISLVKWLSVFSSFWLILSVTGMYVSMTRRQTWRATVILLLYALCFGISVYFNVSFGNQLDMKEVGSDILFKTTVEEIANNKGDAWIPGWLDNIQKQSKVCCGIMTYRDYEEFWPSTPSRIPRSCCKDSKTLPSPCPSDLNLIPFPNTPGDFVKVEMGCMQEILEAVRHHIRESYQNSVTMTVFVACGILAYLVLYTKRYLESAEDAAAQQQKDIIQGGGDGREIEVPNRNQNAILNTGSGPLLITSSGQMGGSIDSFEGIPAFGSMDSFPVQGPGGFPVRQYISDQAQMQMQYRQQQLSAQMQQQPNLQQFQAQQPSQVPLPILQQQQAFQAMQMQQQLPQQWQMPQQQQMQQPSGPMLNKGNVAISGLQQQMLQQQQQNQQLQQQRQNQQLQEQRQNQQLQEQRQNQQLQEQRQNQQLQEQRQNQQLQEQRQTQQLQEQRQTQQLQEQRQTQQLQEQQQNPNQQQQFQLLKPQLQAPQFMDTSMNDNADGGNAPQREAYVTISGAGKSTDRDQSNQIPNMGRNFMQPLLPMGNPDIVVNDTNVARMEQQQQTQDAPVISPPGSPTGRRKKVRKEALANRNNK